ncbi:hypothetical protein GMA11_07055 [Granulicatella sp. zg-ZJ]|uniref:MoaF-related domain-containing protein n=1 Tax=Granulicatella sp. zg-ZJ TaxID=2678504 RepID=UPI0013D4160E|nr:MoaF N-terminal domain-containing protein [Granulicatella sp. zg-ZJ]NEW62149.1 hypothetical protein [Granulicatella sp. zg-ZJ]NEW63152.1 hypothetical protein [Granulicatella sp. zg-ZJ]
MTLFEMLKGKKLDVQYETGFHFIMEYLEEGKLKWTSVGEVEDGGPSEEVDPYEAIELESGKYFINWIEESGMTISQLLDLNNNEVIAFLTWEDNSVRGGRDTLLQKGYVTIVG